MKLWQKINTITGGTTKSRHLVALLNEASIWLVNSLPEKFLWTIATETEVNGWESDAAGSANINEGSSVAYDKILAVYRNDGSANGTVIRRVCREVPDKLLYAFDESNSIYHPTKMFPKFYKLSGKIYIKPTPDYNDDTETQSYTKPGGSGATTVAAGAGDKGVVVYAAAPVVDENTETWILVEWENVVIMYAGALDMLRQSETLQSSATTELTTVATLLSTYDSAVPTISTTAAPVLPSYSLTGSIPSLTLTGSLPTISITDYVDEVIQALPSLPAMGTLTMPSVPTATLAYTAPSGYDLPSALENAPSSPVMGSLPSVPTVSLPSVDYQQSVTAPDFSNANTHLSNEDPELVASRVQIIGTQLQEYSTNIQDNMNSFNKQNAERDATLRQYQQDIGKYQQEVTKTIQKFGADVNSYQAQISKVTQDAQTELGSYDREQRDSIQEFQEDVEQYKSDVQKYTANVGAVIQEFQQKEQAKTGRYNAEAQAFISHFNAKMSQALQKYQQRAASEISRFQQELNKYVQNNQLLISEFQQDLGSYVQQNQVGISKYQQDVAKDMQKYTSEIQGNRAEFQSKMDSAKKSLEQAQMRVQLSSQYQAKAQDKFQKYSALYQAALRELATVTGASAAPPQQQAEQRGEETVST